MGAFIIKFLTYNEHVPNLVTAMSGHELQLRIDQPTRICNTIATLIDHVWVSSILDISISGILYSDLSNHLPVFVTISAHNIQNSTTPEHVQCSRQMKFKAIKLLDNYLQVIN